VVEASRSALPPEELASLEDGAAARPARRVISGLDHTGRSVIVADGRTATRAVRPNGAVVEEIWRQESLPAHATDDGVSGPDLQLAPPPRGAVVRLYTCPPDSEMDMDAYAAAAASIYGAGNAGGTSGIPGMHRTETVDVITVVSGQIVAVFENGETLLGPGDNLIVPGTMHAWSNRSNRPATIVSTVFPLAAA
jgi:mannose-6-phosphate isomerase-like protein (cupin superfamily)